MAPDTNKTAKKMKTVKTAWDKAPADTKKDTSLKHFEAAQKSHAANNDADTNKSLDAARNALS